MNPPARLLAKFRAYPGPRSLYFKVFVWPTKRAMLFHVNGACGAALRGRRDFEALVCPSTTVFFPKRGAQRTRPCLGHIHFHRNSLRMGIICHESGHAALAYCERMGFDVKEKVTARLTNTLDHETGEERFCYALGNIAREIVIGAEKLIYPYPNKALDKKRRR